MHGSKFACNLETTWRIEDFYRNAHPTHIVYGYAFDSEVRRRETNTHPTHNLCDSVYDEV